ncbi:hypothetical protein DV735_g3229, partial [Chaetothyriales sp. CBS 134920]
MRALRYHGPSDLRVDPDVPAPVCGPGQVKIKPAFVGICGSDLHEYSTPTFIPKPGEPHPLTKESWPVVVGHEFSGTVVEIGASTAQLPYASGLKVGDAVAVQPTICCWDGCQPCREAHINSCEHGGFVGLSGWGGGMSDEVCIDGRFVFKLPAGIGLEVGALVEPLAVAWHAVDQFPFSRHRDGDDTIAALVMGAGPIGLGVIQCLKARGVKTIIVVEVAKRRQDFALEFGATHLINPLEEDVVKRTRQICHGNGADVAFDCAGVPASVKSAVLAVRHKGTVVNVAIWEKEVPINPNWLVFGEKVYKAVLSYLPQDFEGVIEALAEGRLKPAGMITSKIAVDRVVEDGFTPLINEKDKHVKILVDMSR